MKPAPLKFHSIKENVMVLEGLRAECRQQSVSTFYYTWNNIFHPQKTTLLVMLAMLHVALVFFPFFLQRKIKPSSKLIASAEKQRIILLSKNSHLKIIHEQSQHSKQEITTSFQLKINFFWFSGWFFGGELSRQR